MAADIKKNKEQWVYYRLLLHERFVGFKRAKKEAVSQYSYDGVTRWSRDVIFHDDGVKIQNPLSAKKVKSDG